MRPKPGGRGYRAQRYARYLLVAANPPTFQQLGCVEDVLDAAKALLVANPTAVAHVYKGCWKITKVDADAKLGR